MNVEAITAVADEISLRIMEPGPNAPRLRLAWLGGCSRCYPVSERDILEWTVLYWVRKGQKLWIQDLPAEAADEEIA